MSHNLKIFTSNVEATALSQINLLLEQSVFANSKIRIMPDVHAGAGCVIGFTADLGDKVIPNIVGVDIGCGVLVAKLSKTTINLQELDAFIKANIPAGFSVNATIQHEFDLQSLYCYDKLLNTGRLALGIGSLGGGNHFIEVDKAEDGTLYLLIHTGSRNLGKQVADLYQRQAIETCRIKQLNIPRELAFLENDDRTNYLHDMRICQQYAILNRQTIAAKILDFLEDSDAEQFESIHNYIDDNNMVRKGAIAAHLNQKIVIPLNMRDGALICEGLGNEDWNKSAPHGAGRLMSRSAARKTLNLSDFQIQMEGVYTTTATKETIDEAPMAYKDASEIIAAIGPTAKILDLIKPIYNFKAVE